MSHRLRGVDLLAVAGLAFVAANLVHGIASLLRGVEDRAVQA
jgi:hypothetical protein